MVLKRVLKVGAVAAEGCGPMRPHTCAPVAFLISGILDRSTPVRACTEAGSSASSRFTSDVTLLLSPLRTTISSTLVSGAAILAAI